MTAAAQQRSIRRHSESWVAPIGRIGIASQGVLYAVVGLLALQVASGHEGDRADQHGALYAVASQSFGRALLLALVRSEYGAGLLRLVAIGLFAFGVYRITDACVRRHDALANA